MRYSTYIHALRAQASCAAMGAKSVLKQRRRPKSILAGGNSWMRCLTGGMAESLGFLDEQTRSGGMVWGKRKMQFVGGNLHSCLTMVII